MSERTLKRILMALAVALVVYSVLGIVQRVRRGSSGGGAGFARVLQSIDTAAVRAILLRGPTDSLALERAGSGWTVNGYESDPEAVTRFLRALASSDVAGVAANNPANHERLGVAGPDAWTLRLETVDGHPYEIILGKTGTRFGTAFARLPGEDAVVSLVGDLRPSTVRSLDQWRNKNVAAVDTARVATIQVETGSGGYTLNRDASAWTLGAATADSFTVATVLGEISRISATGFPTPSEEPAGERRTLVAIANEGDTLLALEGWVAPETFVVRRAGSGTLYELSQWRGDRMMPPPDSLRPR
ncbi:MAG: DUF4340 domain-containing protein [Gemmatimonadota bacterium]